MEFPATAFHLLFNRIFVKSQTGEIIRFKKINIKPGRTWEVMAKLSMLNSAKKNRKKFLKKRVQRRDGIQCLKKPQQHYKQP